MNDRIKTTSIEFKDLKPCASCGGALGLIFHEVTTKLCVLDRGAIGRTLSLGSFFGNGQLTGPGFTLAQVMGADGGKAADRSEDPSTTDVLFFCNECFHGAHLDRKAEPLGQLAAREREKIETAKAQAAS